MVISPLNQITIFRFDCFMAKISLFFILILYFVRWLKHVWHWFTGIPHGSSTGGDTWVADLEINFLCSEVHDRGFDKECLFMCSFITDHTALERWWQTNGEMKYSSWASCWSVKRKIIHNSKKTFEGLVKTSLAIAQPSVTVLISPSLVGNVPTIACLLTVGGWRAALRMIASENWCW